MHAKLNRAQQANKPRHRAEIEALAALAVQGNKDALFYLCENIVKSVL